MYKGVTYVREVCKEKGVSVRVLEEDLGYSNGYLNPKKLKRVPYERAVELSRYLECDLAKILDEGDGEYIDVSIVTDAKEYEKHLKKAASTYYLKPETAAIAQKIFDDKNLRALFDAARGSRPEDLKMAEDLLNRLKGTNKDG